MVSNKKIRDYARIKDVKLWQIASKLNLSDSNFSRLLRQDVDKDMEEKIIRIVDEIVESR